MPQTDDLVAVSRFLAIARAPNTPDSCGQAVRSLSGRFGDCLRFERGTLCWFKSDSFQNSNAAMSNCDPARLSRALPGCN